MKTFNEFLEARFPRFKNLPTGYQPDPSGEEIPEAIPLPHGYSSTYGSLSEPQIPQTRPDLMKDYLQMVKLKRVLKNTQDQIRELEAKIKG
jgi:hypothetical protein